MIELKYTAELIDDAARIILLQSQRKARWNDLLESHGTILKAMEELGCGLSFWTTVVHVNLFGGKEEITSLIRILRTSGFSTKAEPPQEHSPDWAAIYNKPGFDVAFSINFCSRVCQFVKIGTKTVAKEVPVYSVKCGDETIATDIVRE